MANIAIFRINYKSDFILTLNSDAGWMTPFCIKFWTDAPSQAYFVGFDGTTYTHCAPVAGEPTKLLVQFDDHHLPIGDLKFQIGYHFTVADFPTSVEDEVINQASVIIEVDGAPAKVMLDLNGETAPEIEFSLPAYANEAQRIENEQQRIENEQQRIDNEQQRIDNEQTRQRNEGTRIENEHERVREFGQMKGDLEQATRDAAAAAENANEKAVYAKNQGDYAKQQGDYAKQQGDTAKADHERAEDDHRIAGEDHTQAGSDHTRAGEDHTRAESDHAAVEVYIDSLGAFDISAYHATGGVLAKYADLTAALGTNGANVPDALRKGGMSVKFVQSSDNKYVRYNLLATSFTTDTTQWAIEDAGVYAENPEYVYVLTDNKDKIIIAVDKNANVFFGAGVPQQIVDYINEKIEELSLDEYADIVTFLGNLVEGDTLATLLDAKANTSDMNDALALKANASDVNTALDTKVDKEDNKSLINAEYASSISTEDNPEFLYVILDEEDKIIEGIKKDGTLVEQILEVRNIIFKDKAYDVLSNAISKCAKSIIKDYHLPKYGISNIIEETFYLTSNEGYTDKTGVYPIWVYPNTPQNALLKRTCVVFYVKSSLTDNGDGTYSVNENSIALDFYAASKVTEVNTKYYVTESLTEIVDPETGDVSYEVNENSIEVTQIIDAPNIYAWPVDKNTEHYCRASIDFGYYISGTYYVGVKYQGNSTLEKQKRNLRYTFYKNSSFAKKDKIKIGEMVKLSGYNLKAYLSDNSRIKEPILNRILMGVWESRDIYEQYPWNKFHTPYTGATGMIKGFPIRLNIGGEFFGIMTFGIKKDGKNYILDNETDGIFVSCDINGPTVWTNATPNDWTDELNDEMPQAVSDALNSFFTFINSEQFTKENMPERMSILDWIDYFICLQVFDMYDNVAKNMILYTSSDMRKFYPFFYDLDLCLSFGDNFKEDVFDRAHTNNTDTSIWDNFKNIWWDEIRNRYAELRNTVFTSTYITNVFNSISNNIPDSDYTLEKQTWGSGDKDAFASIIEKMEKRLLWLDENYFII